MSEQQQTQLNPQEDPKVINYKRIFIISFVAFLLLSGFVLGSQFFLGKSGNDKEVQSIVTPSKELPSKTQEVSNNPSEKYLNSGIRVIGVYQSKDNPKDIDDYKLIDKVQLIVATDRSQEDGNASSNDSQCGSIYTEPNCYFFIEPLYILDAPPAKYVATLKREGAFQSDSVVFKTPNIVEFMTADGDAGYGYTATWNLNLTTGEIKQISKKEQSSN